jgi:signal peptidase II
VSHFNVARRKKYRMKRSYLISLLILVVLLIDQASKFYIKLNFEYNQDVPIFGSSWARLHFVENEGMAFGITFGWDYGKLALSLFRILLVAGLIWYLRVLAKAGASFALLSSIGLITAGALGNIIDSMFYGLIFTESPYHGGVAQLASAENPAYGTFLHGKVVDMLYFPIKYFDMPEWSPFWAGETMLFFSPIFNVADAAITCGVLSILLFQRSFFKEPEAPVVAPVGTEAIATEEEITEGIAEEASEIATDASEQVVTDEVIAESDNAEPVPPASTPSTT